MWLNTYNSGTFTSQLQFMHKLKLGFNFLFMYDNPSSTELIITALKVDTAVSVWQKRIHTVCKPNDLETFKASALKQEMRVEMC